MGDDDAVVLEWNRKSSALSDDRIREDDPDSRGRRNTGLSVVQRSRARPFL